LFFCFFWCSFYLKASNSYLKAILSTHRLRINVYRRLRVLWHIALKLKFWIYTVSSSLQLIWSFSTIFIYFVVLLRVDMCTVDYFLTRSLQIRVLSVHPFIFKITSYKILDCSDIIIALVHLDGLNISSKYNIEKKIKFSVRHDCSLDFSSVYEAYLISESYLKCSFLILIHCSNFCE
jgi:hypothetical protein